MLREPHALLGQRINIGGADFFLPVTAKLSIAQIVREDEDDVRFGFALRCRLRERDVGGQVQSQCHEYGQRREIDVLHSGILTCLECCAKNVQSKKRESRSGGFMPRCGQE